MALAERLRLGFGLRFAAIAALLFTVYAFPFELFGAKQDWLQGTYIQGRFAMQIVRNCDAADVNILFVSALLAFPGAWRVKAALLLGGVCALVAANVLRICSLYYVGVFAPERFKVVHEEVWPLLLVAFTVLVFLACVRKLQPERVESA
jgi:exosortase/archaeosortase family protein